MGKKIGPTKTELAQYKALNDAGLTPNAVAVKLGRDPKTVRKYLCLDIYKDPEMTTMVDNIKKKNLAYLYFLDAKSRDRPYEQLDKGNTSISRLQPVAKP